MGQALKGSRLFLPLLCLVLSFAFFQTTYSNNDGQPTFPTDDSYIYFQYARQLVSGHPFEYNTGDERTTGMTSILYWILVSVGYAVGFRGELIVYFAFIVGFAGLVVSVLLVRKIGEILAGRQAGFMAALLFCMNGQTMWGYFAGLEIPLFTSILLLAVHSFLKDLEKGTYRRTALACLFLTLSRPEGLLVGCLLAGLLPIAVLLKARREETGGVGRAALWGILPVISSLAYLVLNYLAAGRVSPTTASTKSMWNYPDIYKILYAADHFILDAVRGLFGAGYPSTVDVGFSGTSTVAYFAPLALFFFVFGSFTGSARELRRREIGVSSLLLSVFATGVLFNAFTSASGFQHHRYLIPFYPVFIVCMTAGVYGFCGSIAGGRKRGYLRAGVLAYLTVLTFAGLIVVFTQYTFDTVMIRTTTTSTAEWARDNLDDDDVLGIADAGILKYYSGRKTVDLLGLTTHRFFARWMLGWGSVVEEIKHMPDEERPTYFIMMPSFARLSRGIEPIYELMGDKVHEPWPLYIAGQIVSRADYSALLNGRAPLYEEDGWTLKDSLDVGYVADEERCGYRTFFSRPALKYDVGLHSASYGDGPVIADAGRVVLRGERFTVRTSPGMPLRVVIRSTRAFRTYRFSPVSDGYVDSRVEEFSPVVLRVNGRSLEGAGISTPSDDRWHETVLEVPPEFVTSEVTTFEIMGSYNSFHYWFYQPRPRL